MFFRWKRYAVSYTHLDVYKRQEYEWKILGYLRQFSLGNFSFDPQQIFEVALRVLNITEEQAIAHFVNTFVQPINDGVTPLNQLVEDLNAANPSWDSPIPPPTSLSLIHI